MAYRFVTTNVPPFDGNSPSSDYRLFTLIKQNPGDHILKNERRVETTVTRWHITQDNDWRKTQNKKLFRDTMSQNNVAVTACRSSG